jgi:urease accessory protein
VSAAGAPALQRVSARGALAVEVKAGRTRISTLYQEGAAKMRMPAVAGDPLEAVLINTAGGLTGGDRLAWQLSAGPGASLLATTQACEKVYRAGGGHACLSTLLTVAEGARLAWLPQETILFDRSALRRSLDVVLAPGAEALLLEAVIFGRHAMGERTTQALFSDNWRVRVAGRMVHAEAFAIGPDAASTLAKNAVLAGAAAMATLLLLSPAAAGQVEAAREIVGERGGVSAWSVGGTGKLLARLVAEDGYALRQRLVPLIKLLNGQAGLPKVWSI